MASQLFRKKSIDALIADSEQTGRRLERSLGPWSLTALGIGAVIGSGIFSLTGTAASGVTLKTHSILHAPVLDLLLQGPDAVSTIGRPGAGPAVALSFFILALICGLAGLCYAELASMIPVAGSAYTYAYATMGEIVAWIIGWDLILEYAVSNMAVAVGFSAYINAILKALIGVDLPFVLSQPMIVGGEFSGAWFNLPTLLILIGVTWVLVRGVQESARANLVMVFIKVAAILIFVFGAAGSVQAANYTPFMPNGFSGVLTGAAIVFFTYIGFDSVSTAAEECRNPKRDLPFGIFMTLGICAVLYASVATVLTGVINWKELDTAAPVAKALTSIGRENLQVVVSTGAVIGMLSSLLVFQYGQARIWFVMARDRFLPDRFAMVHPKYQTPDRATWVAGILVGIPAGIFDIGTFADLSNIGTLFAFMLASIGVLVLRRTQPDRARGFRVPWVPVVPMASVFFCFLLMLSLPLETWVRFFAWLTIGLAIYWFYGRRRAAENHTDANF
ncbi:MAG: amino acid permease [Acidobacteriota bacterium]